MPKFILQPIAENAIEHGVLFKENEMGIIKITGNIKGSRITFTITDNGPGISEQKLQDILSGEEKSYGIKNVYERLLLNYNNEFELSYDSKPGLYTTVKLIIPAIYS